MTATRRCADCRRDFEYHQEYQGSPRGVVCRNRRKCAERAAPVNGRRKETPKLRNAATFRHQREGELRNAATFSPPESDGVAQRRNFSRGNA